VNVIRDLDTLPAPEDVVDGPASFELVTAAEAPSRVEVLHVHFGPGARTRWHTHPLGQTLVVTEGRGWVQSRGSAPQALEVGDVVHVQPGEEHWHGARNDSAMAHLAIQERSDHAETDVLEPVSAHDYPTGEDPT
jgi:quercetin dioxygenase-like cupin family protein